MSEPNKLYELHGFTKIPLLTTFLPYIIKAHHMLVYVIYGDI